MWMFAFSPSWNCVVKSLSRSSFAMPPVAAMLPAVSDASDVVSICSVSPAVAINWPFLSMMNTTLAFASFTRRSTIAWIWLNSSSYITMFVLVIEFSARCGAIGRRLGATRGPRLSVGTRAPGDGKGATRSRHRGLRDRLGLLHEQPGDDFERLAERDRQRGEAEHDAPLGR